MIKKNYLRLIIIVIGLLWFLGITFLFFTTVTRTNTPCQIQQGCLKVGKTSLQLGIRKNHRYYLNAALLSIQKAANKETKPLYHFNPIYYIAGLILFLYIANFIYDRFVKKKKEFELKLTPFLLLIYLSVVFFIVYSQWVSYYQLDTPIHYPGIFLKYPALVGAALFVAISSLALGKKIYHWIISPKHQLEIQYEWLFSFGLGMMTIIYVLFVFGLFGWLKTIPVWIFFGVIILLCIKEFIYWIKLFFTSRLDIKTSYFGAMIFLILYLAIFYSHNALDLIRPLPVGFDDMAVYINNPKLMAASGRLLSGIMSYPWELFTSLGFTLFNNMAVTLYIHFMGSIFGFFALYFLITQYLKKRGFVYQQQKNYALFATTLFYTLPMVVFQTAADLKVDLASFYFAMIAWIAFYEWKNHPPQNRPNTLLYFAAFLAGFAFAIKYTALIFGVTLLIYLIYILFKQKQLTQKIALVGIFAVLLLLPVSPILIRNIYQTRSLSIANIRFGKTEMPQIILNPPLFDKPAKPPYEIIGHQIPRSAEREELTRFTGYQKGIVKYLRIPFIVTFNPYAYGQYIDISFLFLAFLPLGLIYLIFLRQTTKSQWRILSEIIGLGLFYWLIWLAIASGVIWYGLAGFIFLLLIFIEIYHQVKLNRSPIVYYIINIIIIIWFLMNLIVRTAVMGDNVLALDMYGIQYARGNINGAELLHKKFQIFLDPIEKINQDILSHPQNPPKVYRMGTHYKYFFAKNNITVMDDNLLDKFNYAYQDNDDQKMFTRLKNSGFKYLIVDLYISSLDNTPEKSLTKKYQKFRKFVNNNQSHFRSLIGDPNARIKILEIIY